VLAVAFIKALRAQDDAIWPGHAGHDGFEHHQAAVRADEDVVRAHRQASLTPSRIQAVGGQLPENTGLGLVERTAVGLKQIRVLGEELAGGI